MLGIAGQTAGPIGLKFCVDSIFLIKKNKISNFFLAYDTPGHPWVSTKKFSPLDPAVWPAIRNIYIYTNVLFYYTDIVFFIGKLNYMATKETSFNVKKKINYLRTLYCCLWSLNL